MIKEINTCCLKALKENRNNMTKQYTYSNIIEPEDYNKIINTQHLYVTEAHEFIYRVISKKIQDKKKAELVELGCGPGQLLRLVSQLANINLTAIDIDLNFINFAKKIVGHLPVQIMSADIITYQHHCPVDIFFSQGVHHHIPKGKPTTTYLKNVYTQLKSGGYYILSDEFIAEYTNEQERALNLIIWYSHIIAHALKFDYSQLACEEAKTLLDDLHEGHATDGFKTQHQINLVLEKAPLINSLTENDNHKEARKLAQQLIEELNLYLSMQPCGNNTLDLFRGDYKICDKILRDEVTSVGFTVESVTSFGPTTNIGSLAVYLLKK